LGLIRGLLTRRDDFSPKPIEPTGSPKLPADLRNRALGPWSLRHFLRWFEGPFQRFFVVAWFGTIGLFLLVSISGLDRRLGIDLGSASRFAVLPLMIILIGVIGIAILWQLLLLRKHLAHALPLQRLAFFAWLLAGLVFLGGAVALAFTLVFGKSG
jgi:hypothetical protein